MSDEWREAEDFARYQGEGPEDDEEDDPDYAGPVCPDCGNTEYCCICEDKG